ncbi:MAG: PQQ-binding-like beta-propeller repeat protein, partial [Bacteroidales bacterium]|nr:PQQ-binding-like beta-propeller repeat protein [Bacteroidales bacterium]
FGDDSGTLYKVSATSGTLLGSFQANGAIRSSPAVVPYTYITGLVAGQDYVYFGSDDGYIYAINGNTMELRDGWPVATGGQVRGTPIIDGYEKTVIIGSEDGKTYTLNIGP